MKTNYAGHDGLYQARRAEGRAGWATEAQVAVYHALLTRTLALAPRSKILEVGCGDGVNAVWLAGQGHAVSGVDISPAAIAWARDKAAAAGVEARFEVGDVLDLAGFPSDAFDVVLDGHCLHCIIGADRGAFLESALRVLKPGGRLHVCAMCGDVDPSIFEGFDPQTRCLFIGDTATRYIGAPQDILAEIRAAGFDVQRWEIAPRAAPDDLDDLVAIALKPS